MNKVQISIYVISFILVGIAVGILFSWHTENVESAKVADNIKNSVITKNVPNDPSKIQIINPPEENSKEYESLIEEPLLDINIEDFASQNSDTVGWISVDGTDVDYPVVQTSDNNYYLTHSFDGSYNSSGWIFGDYRNNFIDFDKNTVIYGHNRLNNTMFATLTNVLDINWYQNSSWGIDLVTLTKDTKWQIVSVYKVPSESYYITTNFDSDNNYLDFLNTILERSYFDFATTLDVNDNILTLSTCTNVNNGRLVVHAKLVKSQLR